MKDTIGNPLSWGAHEAAVVARKTGVATQIGHDTDDLETGRPTHHRPHLRDVLRKGVEAFGACRTDVVALCLFYPAKSNLRRRFGNRSLRSHCRTERPNIVRSTLRTRFALIRVGFRR